MGKRGTLKKTPAKTSSSSQQIDILTYLSTPTSQHTSSIPTSVAGDPQTMASPSPPPNHPNLQGDFGEILKRLDTLPTKQDIQDLESRILDNLNSQTISLRTDLTQVTVKLTEVENAQEDQATTISILEDTLRQQANAIQAVQRHLEDLDNRGRRNNLRVRGLPEDIPPQNLENVLTKIFNTILNNHPDTAIVFDRAHRALKPKGLPSDRPRDIICRLHYYKVKEEILQKSRRTTDLQFESHPISIFQDLSWNTLQQRRLLRPLTEMLRKQNIRYRWGFPFNIQASVGGKSATLNSPEEMTFFCETLNIPEVPLTEWSRFRQSLTPTLPPTQRDQWQPARRQKRKSPRRSENNP